MNAQQNVNTNIICCLLEGLKSVSGQATVTLDERPKVTHVWEWSSPQLSSPL